MVIFQFYFCAHQPTILKKHRYTGKACLHCNELFFYRCYYVSYFLCLSLVVFMVLRICLLCFPNIPVRLSLGWDESFLFHHNDWQSHSADFWRHLLKKKENVMSFSEILKCLATARFWLFYLKQILTTYWIMFLKNSCSLLKKYKDQNYSKPCNS